MVAPQSEKLGVTRPEMNPDPQPASPPPLSALKNRRALFEEALDAFAVIFGLK
jgi:hypothetical protein